MVTSMVLVDDSELQIGMWYKVRNVIRELYTSAQAIVYVS